jgi:hypothetical protein
LRKGLKIKAYFILLAWAVIFLHNIIPHVHEEEQPGYCHSVFHSFCNTTHNDRNEDTYASASENEGKVCHFSVNMLHPSGFGDIACYSGQNNDFDILSEKESLYIPHSERNGTQYENGATHLRAPPVI